MLKLYYAKLAPLPFADRLMHRLTASRLAQHVLLGRPERRVLVPADLYLGLSKQDR